MGGKRKRARQLQKNLGNTAYQQSKKLQKVVKKKIKYKNAVVRHLVELGILSEDGITIKQEYQDIGLALKL